MPDVAAANKTQQARAALEALQADPVLAQRIVDVRCLDATPAKFADPDSPIPAEITDALVDAGVTGLYAHQATAVEHARARESFVIATGTASGKSLAYWIPVAERVTARGDNRAGRTALALFPTKALARDQLRSLRRLRLPGIEAAVVDGDTPAGERDWARKHANVILTNPDMLHRTILPGHRRWLGFFRNLDTVVVDEVHTLRGLFGAHVAHVLRRLRRISAIHETEPIAILTSATLGNPGEIAAKIWGEEVVTIDADASPAPERYVVCWNPPLIDIDTGRRMSALGESGRLMSRLVQHGLQTLAFCSSRKGVEMCARVATDDAGTRVHQQAISAYRGGYLPEERREIEDAIADGTIRGLAATNALELGMDIGGLDAVICTGFPGTLASFRQQIGRTGRGQNASLAILVAGADALDQWYLSHADELFSRPAERAVVNTANRCVDEPHLACAAFEHALEVDDPILGDNLDERAAGLLAAGELRMRHERLYSRSGRTPARGVDIRSGAGTEFRILDLHSEVQIGSVDAGRVFTSVHPGAVYMHRSDTFVVTDLDLDARVAHVDRFDADFYTQPRTDTSVSILTEDASRDLGAGGMTVSLGSVEVTQRVTGFRRRLFDVEETLNSEKLDLPARRLETRAFWYTVADAALEDAGIGPDEVPGTVHACEHAGIGILPRFAICDRWDVGGVSMPVHPQTGVATWFIYDAYTGGAGISDAGFATGDDHVRATREVIDACGCQSGCPSCTQSPKCGNWNEPLEKYGAVRLLNNFG